MIWVPLGEPHSHAGEGVGGPKSYAWTETLVLYILYPLYVGRSLFLPRRKNKRDEREMATVAVLGDRGWGGAIPTTSKSLVFSLACSDVLMQHICSQCDGLNYSTAVKITAYFLWPTYKSKYRCGLQSTSGNCVLLLFDICVLQTSTKISD